jgi:hypothetical protein
MWFQRIEELKQADNFEDPSSAANVRRNPRTSYPEENLSLFKRVRLLVRAMKDRSNEGATPDSLANSRAQRARTNVGTYNLKALSAVAQGKYPRKPRQKDKTAVADTSGIIP